MSSDDGCCVKVYRSDSVDLSSEDQALVKAAVSSLQKVEPDRIPPYCEFDFTYGGSHRIDGCEGLLVTLSEYWIGDHERNEGCDPEYLVQRDSVLVQQFADELQRFLGESYEVDAYCDAW